MRASGCHSNWRVKNWRGDLQSQLSNLLGKCYLSILLGLDGLIVSLSRGLASGLALRSKLCMLLVYDGLLG